MCDTCKSNQYLYNTLTLGLSDICRVIIMLRELIINMMKSVKIIAAVVFLLITSNVVGQDEEETDNREKLQFGLKAGTNFSNVYNERSEEFRADGKLGFAGGAFLRVPISKYLGVQPEVLLSQKGFKGEGSFLGSEYSFTRTTTYIDIPLQIAFNPSEFITIVAGPQYSYLIKQKDDFNSAFINTTHEEEFENENIRKNIFGFVAGLDINIKHVVIGARAGFDLMDNHGDGSSSTPQYKNMWFQGTIGYTFYKD